MAKSLDKFLRTYNPDKPNNSASKNTTKQSTTSTTQADTDTKPRKSFDEFLRTYNPSDSRKTTSTISTIDSDMDAQTWVERSNTLLSDLDDYYSTWRSDSKEKYDSYNDEINTLLASAGQWRSAYADDEEALETINAVAKSLSKAKDAVYTSNKHYSQWSTEEAYNRSNAAQDLAKRANTLLTDAQNYYSTWHKDNKTRTSNYTKQLDALIESANKLEAENIGDKKVSETLNTAIKALTDGKNLVSENSKYYSQFASVDAYKEAREAQRKQQEEYEAKWGKYTKEADFAEYAKKGAEIENPEFKNVDGTTYLAGWRPGFKEPGNVVTYSRDNIDKVREWEEDKAPGMVGRSLYMQMKDEEVELYNYLLAKQGKEVAQEYLDSLEETLNQRLGNIWGENIRNIDNRVLRTAATGVYGLTAGVDQWSTGARQFFTNEEQATSAMQFGSQYIMNDLAAKDPETGAAVTDKQNLNQMLYGATTTIGNMAPSILVSSLTGNIAGALGAGAKAIDIATKVAGGAAMGISSAGNTYKWALEAGYDVGKARTYSTLVGASEAALSAALGGVGKFSGVTEAKLLSKVAAVDDVLARFVLTGAVKLGEEVLEEELQLFLEPLFKKIVLNEEYDTPTAREMFETAVVTAFSTGALEGASVYNSTFGQNRAANAQYSGKNDAYAEALAKYIKDGKSGKDAIELAKADIKKTFTRDYTKQQLNERAGKIAAESVELDPNNKRAAQIQQKLKDGKNVSGYSIDLLAGETDIQKIKSGAAARLTELGATENVDTIAGLIAKYAAGEELTKAEQDTLRRNRYAPDVLNELNPNLVRAGVGAEWVQKLGTDKINPHEYSKLVEKAQIQPTTLESIDGEVTSNPDAIAQDGANAATAEASAELSPEELQQIDAEVAKAETSTILNIGDKAEAVEIESVESAKNGRMVLRLKDGRTVSSENVTHASKDTHIVYNAARMLAPDAKTANAIVNNFKPGMDVDKYI